MNIGGPRGGALSADLQYPGCPSCERNPAGVFTQHAPNPAMFVCVRCNHRFGDTTTFTTVQDLPETQRIDFTACVIVGLKHREQAERRGVSRQTVTGNVGDARRNLSVEVLADFDRGQPTPNAGSESVERGGTA